MLEPVLHVFCRILQAGARELRLRKGDTMFHQRLMEYLRKISPWEKELMESGSAALVYVLESGDEKAQKRETASSPLRKIDVLKMPRQMEIGEHPCDYLELVYVVEGSCRHLINGQETLELHTGDLLILKPGVRHSIARIQDSDLVLHFLVIPELLQTFLPRMADGTLLKRFLTAAMNRELTEPAYLRFHLQEFPEVENLVENMTISYLRGGPYSQKLICATMEVLFLLLVNKNHIVTFGEPSDYERQLVMDAMNYIEENYKGEVSLENFSRISGQPAYYISRLMKRYSAYNFTSYLQRRRLLQAAFLLMETQKPIEDIIVEVGYENSSYFHKIFKKQYRMTPKEYRRKYSS